MKPEFQNKVALVTGASSGIGYATARAFGRSGAKVALADIDSDKGEHAIHELRDEGAEAIFLKCDVSNEEEVKALIAETVTRFGRLDLAFNNAGVEGAQARTADCTTANWDRVLGVNLKGVWLCMREEIPVMLKNGGGAIVNTSSIAGLVGFAGIPAYTASKHGILGLTKAAALEYAQLGIWINAVCPGVIETPMIDRFTQSDPSSYAKLIAGEPVGRIGQPQEIADAVLWLCSPSASFVTGHPLVVDGGWVAQ